MNRSVLIGVVAVTLAAGAGAVIYLSRPKPAPVIATAPDIVPSSAPRETARTEPAPAPAAAPRPSRRAAAPVAAPAPEAPPPVVAEAAPTGGRLHITADVPGAQVFIDRQFVGAAPVVAENVKPGSHQINVAADGFDSVVQTVDVEAGDRDIAVKFHEIRLSAAVDVVHKHGMGSCRGRLVADGKGLRYETTNKDDAFTTALLDLDTFEVNYLDKNLRIKLKRGKQYNFTDPDGNADRLFVFQRDVEKARERLRKGDQLAAN